MKQFYFTYDSDEDDCGPEFPLKQRITSEFTVYDEATWDVVLQKFLEFLSSVWGYDISKKVNYETLSERLDKLHENGKLSDEDWEEVKGW